LSRGIHCDICICAYNISYMYLLILLPRLRIISKVQQVLFFYYHVWIQNTSTIFTLIPSFLVPTPSHWYPPQKRFIFPSCSPFLKNYVSIIQGGFTLVLPVCIYRGLIKLTPPLQYLLILCHHALLIFNSLQCIMLYSYIRWGVSVFFIL
jgi:hypothetical protein